MTDKLILSIFYVPDMNGNSLFQLQNNLAVKKLVNKGITLGGYLQADALFLSHDLLLKRCSGSERRNCKLTISAVLKGCLYSYQVLPLESFHP